MDGKYSYTDFLVVQMLFQNHCYSLFHVDVCQRFHVQESHVVIGRVDFHAVHTADRADGHCGNVLTKKTPSSVMETDDESEEEIY